jgi:uncharacterized membrane protein YagU involved in acid resistance
MPFYATTNDASGGLSSFSNALNIDQIQGWLSDIQLTVWLIVGMLFFSLFVGFVYMVLMRYCSGVLVWTSIIALCLSLIALTYLQFQKLMDLKESDLYVQ